MGEFLVDRNIIQLRIITSGKIVSLFISNRIIRIKRCRSFKFANFVVVSLFNSNWIIRIKRCRSLKFANFVVNIVTFVQGQSFGCGLLPASDCGVVLFGGGWLHSNHVSDNRNIPNDEVNNSRHDDLTLKFVMLEFCTGTCIISE